MSDDPDSYSQAEIVRLLKGIQQDMGDLRTEVHAFGGTFVTRAELTAWQTAYDREVKQLRTEIAETKAATAPVKTSPWTIAGFFVAAVVGIGSLLGLAITLITILK